MNYIIVSSGPQTEIKLVGHLTFADYQAFREVTDKIDHPACQEATLDLSEMEFIDSAGLGMLLLVREKMVTKNGQVCLRGSHGQVKKMLDLGKFDALFKVA